MRFRSELISVDPLIVAVKAVVAPIYISIALSTFSLAPLISGLSLTTVLSTDTGLDQRIITKRNVLPVLLMQLIAIARQSIMAAERSSATE